MNEAELKAALDAYLAADEKLQEAINKQAALMQERSDILKKLALKSGIGPYEHNGKFLGTIIERDDTAFFRGPGKKKIISVG